MKCISKIEVSLYEESTRMNATKVEQALAQALVDVYCSLSFNTTFTPAT
jgi:hypothetical protein